MAETARRSAGAAGARASTSERWLTPLRHAGSRLLLLILFNLAFTPNFATWQTLNVNLTQVCADRHRRRRHDAGDRHRRHRPVGRLAHGDRRRAGAADLPRQALSPARTRRSASRSPSSCRSWSPARFGWFNGWLITRFRIQPIVATLVLFIAGRGIAQVLTNGNLQVFNDAGVPVHRPRPRLRHPGPGHHHGRHRGARGLDAAAHRVRPADPRGRRQRAGGPARRHPGRRASSSGSTPSAGCSPASPG